LSEEGEEEEGGFSGEVLVETLSSDEMAVWEGEITVMGGTCIMGLVANPLL
jgi:hypothetical protein